MMTFIEAFKKELAQEAIQTRRMLEIIPADKLDWRPHPKSMDIRTLATHLAEIPDMITNGLLHPKWDFAEGGWQPQKFDTAEELVARFDECLSQATDALNASTDDILQEKWLLCSGDQIFMELERWETFRHAMGQNAHHRAQLQVCLRLLNIPVPGPYGPSADEMGE